MSLTAPPLELDELHLALSWRLQLYDGAEKKNKKRKTVHFKKKNDVFTFFATPDLNDMLAALSGYSSTARASLRNRQLLMRFLEKSLHWLDLSWESSGATTASDSALRTSGVRSAFELFTRGDAERWRKIASRFPSFAASSSSSSSSSSLQEPWASSLEAFLNAALDQRTLFTAEHLAALQAPQLVPHKWEDYGSASLCSTCGRRVRKWCVECEACHACECGVSVEDGGLGLKSHPGLHCREAIVKDDPRDLLLWQRATEQG